MAICASPAGQALRMTEVTTRKCSDECLDVRIASGVVCAVRWLCDRDKVTLPLFALVVGVSGMENHTLMTPSSLLPFSLAPKVQRLYNLFMVLRAVILSPAGAAAVAAVLPASAWATWTCPI